MSNFLIKVLMYQSKINWCVFYSASKSPFSHLMDEYVTAERIGSGEMGPGECFPYFKECPKSLFVTAAKNKYAPEAEDADQTESSSKVEMNINTIAM